MRHPLVATFVVLLCTCGHGVRVASEAAGRVEAVYVEKGSCVHTGDMLIQLDTHDTLLRRSGIITRIDLAELREADATELYRELERVNVDLTKMTITAPVDGRVVWFAKVRVGDSVRIGELLVVVR